MAQFKTRARALDLLGRQQIAGIPTAINELIKNAHDAYADKFDIDFLRCNNLLVLRDDGLGMTKEEFETRWLTLGTESKLANKKAVYRLLTYQSQDVLSWEKRHRKIGYCINRKSGFNRIESKIKI